MDDPTLLIVWLFTWLAIAVMGTRILLVKANKKPFCVGDYLTMGAIFCALTRLALIHVVLIWGSNNVTAEFRKTHHFTSQEIYHREIGGKLTITNRFFYNSYLWLQKMVLLDFYRHLLSRQRWERLILIIYLVIFAGSYMTVQIITFTECNPFNHYWIVFPAPGTCTKAQVQLITLGVLNIVTDVMLIVLPLPILSKLKRPFRQKVQLYILFSLGIFIVIITIIRLPQNASHSTAQVNRTTWASAELLTAALVVNAPALYGLAKKIEKPRTAAPQPDRPQIIGPPQQRDGANLQMGRMNSGVAAGHYSLSSYDGCSDDLEKQENDIHVVREIQQNNVHLPRVIDVRR